MYIGFFDSGIGGLSVLKEALKILPNENYIYYGDTENAPYGTKTKEEVKDLTFRAVEFLDKHKIKALVVACNTATSAAVRELREKYSFPIIGMEPAIKPAVENNQKKGKRVLTLATPLTLKEEKFQSLISKFDVEHIVDMLPAPKLVEFAEKFIFSGPCVENYLRDIMPANINEYGTVVLGCTHFPLFRDVLSKLLPESTDIIDGNRGTVNHLYDILKKRNLLNPSSEKGQVIFYKSGKLVEDESLIEKYKQIIYD
ncbi:MAG: glutamate racemase [Clostridiaceae bacterium]|nr:glutamate racemase [Clostridiaceae bacterium]